MERKFPFFSALVFLAALATVAWIVKTWMGW